MKIKSLNCSSCPWIFAFSSIACDEYECRICFKDKILLRMIFILSAWVLRSLLLLEDCQLSVFHSPPLSLGINQLDFYRWIIIDFEYGYFKGILRAYTFIFVHTFTKKLIPRTSLHCRASIEPPIEWMYLHPTCLVLGMFACWPRILAICYHLAHFPSALKKANSASYLAASASSPHAGW